MEYVYAALLLKSAEKDINEENLKNVLEATGASVDNARIKALVSSLDGVNIDEVIKNAVMAPAAAVASAPSSAPVEEKKEEEKEEEEEEEVSEEEAAAGLGALFG